MQVSVVNPNPAASAMMMDTMRQTTQRQSMAVSMSRTQMTRTCTDILCLVIYGLLIVSLAGAYFLTQYDGVKQHAFPRDFDHNSCLPPYNYLYIPTSNPMNSVCVNLCPLQAGIRLQCQTNSLFSNCPSSIQGLIRDEQFHLCYLIGTQISIPNRYHVFWNLVLQHQSSILKAAGYVALFALILVILTLAAPDIMAYITIFLLEVFLLGLAILCFYRYFSGGQSFINTYLPYYFKTTRALLVIAGLLFAAAVISLLTIFYRLAQIRFLVLMLRIARQCVLQNLFILFMGAFLSGIYIGIFYLNMKILNHALSLADLNFNNRLAHDQLETRTSGILIGCIWFIQFLWTHGVLISLSHFIFECWATFWYYNHLQTTFGGLQNMTRSLRFVFYHFGTIIFGAIYPYYSQSLTNISNNLEYDCANNIGVYNTFCCLHNCCCRYLSVYSYIQTALKSFDFWPANLQMYHIRVCMSRDLRRLYLLGSYYTNSAKYLAITLGMLLCYFNLRWDQDIFTNLLNVIPPVIIAGMLSAQVATCFIDSTGLVADTILLNYYMEFEFYRANMVTAPMNCPATALIWIQQALALP